MVGGSWSQVGINKTYNFEKNSALKTKNTKSVITGYYEESRPDYRFPFLSPTLQLFFLLLMAMPPKRITLIRHGMTEANLWLSQPETAWGIPNFSDDLKYLDSILCGKGKQQCECLNSQILDNSVDLTTVSRVLVSPLTRTLQTETQIFQDTPLESKLVACSLLRERRYLASDVGKHSSILKTNFPAVDFNDKQFFPHDENSNWWYEHDDTKPPYVEFRPHSESQTYTAKGEPDVAFEERLNDLFELLSSTPENEHVACVTSWGVIRGLTGGKEFDNCHAKTFVINELDPSLHRSGLNQNI